MADFQPKNKRKAQEQSADLLDRWAAMEGKPLPPTFIAGRGVNIQLAALQTHLFTAMEEAENPNYLVYELRRSVEEVDFAGFTFALCQTLYNQSYLSDNKDVNSGIERAVDNGLKIAGQNFIGGMIATTLNDLCRLAYGVENPSTDQRKKISSIIDILRRNRLPMSIPKTDKTGKIVDRIKVKDTLVFPVREGERESDGAKYYVLYLHPIFCSLAEGFLEAPQDLTKQLSAVTNKKAAYHYHLLRVLLLSRKPPKYPPLVRYTDTLLEELGLAEAYQKQPSRTEEQIIEACKVMEKIGIITGFEDARGRKGRRKTALLKLTFHYNPNYIQKSKTNKQKQLTTGEATD